MSELSFLIELLLEHNLPAETKKALAARIKDVEGGLQRPQQPQHVTVSNWSAISSPITAPQQAASTLAAMARHGTLNPEAPTVSIIPQPPPEPVAVIAQTPAAAAAMASRNQAINESLAGKVDKTTGRPRKF